MDALSANPGRPERTHGQEARGARVSGETACPTAQVHASVVANRGVFSWFLLLDKQKKELGPPGGGRNNHMDVGYEAEKRKPSLVKNLASHHAPHFRPATHMAMQERI